MNETVANASVTVKKREFSALECAFAWISLVSGYFFCRFFPAPVKPFGAMIFAALLFIVTAVFVLLKGAKLNALSVFSLSSSLILLGALFFSSNGTVHFFVSLYALLSYLYFVSSAFGNSLEKGFSNLIAADYFKALLTPFVSLTDVFSAIARGRAKQRAKVFLKILLGVAIAFIPTAIVLSLLSYDKDFMNILKKIFQIDFWSVISNLFSIAFGVPVGMYIFGAFISSADKKGINVLSAEKIRKTAGSIRVFSWITAVAASLPLLALYVIFFISQWKYYVSGFVGVLPDTESYAEYARKGFFQLCTVAVINLLVILALTLFMKREQKAKRVVLKVLSLLFSVFTLILISTAIAKMVLYINEFGLTPKRVYASWFMLVLAVIFLLVILKQAVSKIKIVPSILIVAVVMSALISLAGTEEYIAKYNVDRYINGTLKTVDVSAIEDLGDSGIPQAVRLAKHLEKERMLSIKYLLKLSDAEFYDTFLYSDDVYMQTVNLIRNYNEYKDNKILSLTLPRIKANNSLKSIGIK